MMNQQQPFLHHPYAPMPVLPVCCLERQQPLPPMMKHAVPLCSLAIYATNFNNHDVQRQCGIALAWLKQETLANVPGLEFVTFFGSFSSPDISPAEWVEQRKAQCTSFNRGPTIGKDKNMAIAIVYVDRYEIVHPCWHMVARNGRHFDTYVWFMAASVECLPRVIRQNVQQQFALNTVPCKDCRCHAKMQERARQGFND